MNILECLIIFAIAFVIPYEVAFGDKSNTSTLPPTVSSASFDSGIIKADGFITCHMLDLNPDGAGGKCYVPGNEGNIFSGTYRQVLFHVVPYAEYVGFEIDIKSKTVRIYYNE